MSTLSTPKSSITIRNPSTRCGLISSVCSVVEALPDIDGLPIHFHDKHGTSTPPLSSSGYVASLVPSSSETECGSRFQEDFYDAYQQHSRTAHMGILDPSYQVFTSQHGHGAIVYKVKNRTLIVTGDPLCAPEQFSPLLEELRQYRAEKGLKIAFMGVSETFAKYVRDLGWATFRFGRERIVNPISNPVLRKGAGKRMLSQTRQLLDPKRGGLTIHLYSPSSTSRELALEVELQRLYDCWREERNCKHGTSSQAFVTVYDLFSHPDKTCFLYTKDRNGCANGLATLRSLGANGGFHLDPCIASSSAPRGVSDLLVIAAMKLLSRTGIDYLSLGYEPFSDLQEIRGQSGIQAWLTQKGYRRVMQAVPVDGKAAYFNKFRPDDSKSSDLYIAIPSGLFQVQQSTALMHIANLKMSSFFSLSDVRTLRERRPEKDRGSE
ncbi:hypothetical protein B0T10DRAFT_37728 [Thelonectria olida]|uniref:Phosphatidylglycerol lysyltransferase C-terminal domain-containing protein n=1 Tax=Thelonectria olida TaxID=1576542 RepID=A0A9P8WLY0_9HYPO|nr:hypothetical protein B0T10DRAFT_37728 [Thelonectria olida]